jgi:16S rRNA (guanine966-N2)-methyltransferase
MRVIAGVAKGTRLTAPKGLEVRPTLDRVREALFSILAPRIEGAHFLDLFAGTGANGIEALSRGAELSTFVENDPRSLQTIRRNLEATRLISRASVRRLELPSGLYELCEEGTRYDIVFADPPYDLARQDPDAYMTLLNHLHTAQILANNAMIVIEHDSRAPIYARARLPRVSEKTADFACARHARYGETTLSFFS